MNKKAVVAIIGVIAIVLISIPVVSFLLTPPKVTATYRITHGLNALGDNAQSYEGETTWIVVYLNLTSTKTTNINLEDFYLSYNGEELANLRTKTELDPNVELVGMRTTENQLLYVVAGKLDGPFELSYTGSVDVTIS
jgi:hypothetical protein